ncbi:hypothetical protein OIU84_022602 [Salix udensis]|uniref:DUF4220 domain-containing protein n=1 Tax=Salix udensis TaxID=889485 RepID=A0AAD6KPF6_9ROSI|nr:hypothetical protein OIU84_022602 [Salix udensis]
MIDPIPDGVKRLWDDWNIRSAILDAVATFAIGHISTRKGTGDPKYRDSSDLLAFWAPFLLVHLGGPDTITAFALEDNELWLRHLLTFATQGIATLYVFLLTLTREQGVDPDSPPLSCWCH